MAADLGPGVRWAFPDRWGGVSASPYAETNLALHVGDDPAAVGLNRRRVADDLGLPAARIVWMDQVHGDRIAAVDAAPETAVVGVDGLVTTTPGLGLAVLVADCTPVLLADPAAAVVGVVHAGREGLRVGVVAAAVAAMCGLGASPARMRALLGPAVCGRCYEVPAALREQVAAVVPAAASTTRRGTPALDIGAGIRAQLAALGVSRAATSPVCTAEDPAYFSVRRDGTTGRFAGFLWIAPP